MSSEAWKKENTIRVVLRITKSSGIPTALERVKNDTGEESTVYIRRIVHDALIRDGYLQETQAEK